MSSSLIRRKVTGWIILILAVCAGLSDAPAAESQSTGGKHFLWRVTNAPAPFYLLGSIQALPRSDYRLAPAIEDAVNRSQRFVFEYDLREGNSLLTKLAAAAKYPAGVTVRQKVNPKTYAYLEKISRAPKREWVNLKPWAIADFKFHHPGYESFSSRVGIDAQIYNKVRSRAEITGLESVDEHVRVLSDMTDAEAENYLLDVLVHADEGPQRFKEAVVAWKSGNTQRLYQLYAPIMNDAPAVWSHFLDRRNANWIPHIERETKSGKPTMIIATALHFTGPHSVIAMLKARGYKIEQL